MQTELLVLYPQKGKIASIHADTNMLNITGTIQERQFVDFFYRHTAPALSGTFDGSFVCKIQEHLLLHQCNHICLIS